MINNSKSHQQHSVQNGKHCLTVRLLEDDSMEINVSEGATGKWLCEEVCRTQGVLEEREYFGLRYLQQDKASFPTKQWLDPTRSVLSQLKNTHPKLVSFRFKHYPSEPLTDLRLAKTHYLLYQQLRRDLLSGRLIASVDEMAKLGALVVQVELGDSSVQDAPQLSADGSVEYSYLTDFRVLHNQTHRMQCLMLEEHKKLEGLLPSEAADDLIQLASSLETYGIDPVRVKTKAYGSRPIHLGLTHRGVAEFLGNRCRKCHLWSTVSWMTCDGKNFVVTTVEKPASEKKKGTVQSVQYKCESKAAARALWEWATDRRLFLTLEKSSTAKPVKAKNRLFSRTLTYRFSGRCRREVVNRPPLVVASTLPANFSHIEGLSDEPASNHAVSPYSVSMMALSNASNTPEIKPLRPIGEDHSAAGSDMWTTATATATTTSSGATSTTAAGDLCVPSLEPIITGLEVAISEPVARASPLSFGSSVDQEDEDGGSLARKVASSGQRSALASQTVSLFNSLPRRRYAPEAMARQTRLARDQEPDLGRSEDFFDHEEEKERRAEEEAAIAALQSATEAEGTCWMLDARQDVASEVGSRSGSGRTAFFSFLRSSSPKPSPDSHRSVQPESQPSSSTKTSSEPASKATDPPPSQPGPASGQPAAVAGQVTSETSPSDAVPSSSGWRLAAVSVGVLALASVVGFGLLMDSEVYSPATSALRGHPWLLDFDSRYFRPARSAFFGFWRR